MDSPTDSRESTGSESGTPTLASSDLSMYRSLRPWYKCRILTISNERLASPVHRNGISFSVSFCVFLLPHRDRCHAPPCSVNTESTVLVHCMQSRVFSQIKPIENSVRC